MNNQSSSEPRKITSTSYSVDLFVDFSVILSGFSATELWGTDMVQGYYDETRKIIGEREMGNLLGAFSKVLEDEQYSEALFESNILKSSRYGPVARNIIRLWYLGAWKQLPREWRNTYGATSCDIDHIISSKSYQESLVWIAGGAHPMGAKQQGFGSWAKAGRLSDCQGGG